MICTPRLNFSLLLIRADPTPLPAKKRDVYVWECVSVHQDCTADATRAQPNRLVPMRVSLHQHQLRGYRMSQTHEGGNWRTGRRNAGE